MNYFYLFCASLLTTASIIKADPPIQHEPGIFFNETEKQHILNRLHLEEDLVVLRNGAYLFGKVLKLPDVYFPYGNFPLEAQDVSAIAFAEEENRKKIQLITHDGHSMILQVKNDTVHFTRASSDSKIEPSGYQEIGVEEISCLLMHKAPHSSGSKLNHLYCIELKDGCQFPAVFAEEDIHLNNGWYPFSISSNRILDVKVDGGLYGTILDRSGNKSPIEYVFFENSHVPFKLFNSSSVVKVPWSRIQAIRKYRGLPAETMENVVDHESQFSGLSDEKIEKPSLCFSPDSGSVDPEQIACHVDSKEDEIRKLKKKLVELTKQSHDLLEVNRTLTDSNHDLAQAKCEMQKKIDQLLEQVSVGKDRILSLNENLLKSNSMLSNKNRQFIELSNDLETIKSEKESLLQLIEQNRKEMHISEDAHARQLEILASEIQALCHRLSIEEQEQAMLIEKTVQLTNQLSESHQSLEIVKKEIEEKDSLTGILEKEMNEFKTKLKDALQDKQELAEQIKGVESQNQQFLAKHAELKAMLDASRIDLEKLNELAEQSKAQLSEKEAEFEQLEKNYNEAVRREKEAIDAFANARDEGAQALAQASQLNEQLLREKKLGSEYKRKMDQLFPQYDMEKEKNLQLRQQVSHFQQRVKEFEDELKAAEKKRLNDRDRCLVFAKNNQQLLQENEELANRLRQVQVRLQEQRDLASKLNESINAVNQDVDNSRQHRNHQSAKTGLFQANNDHRNEVNAPASHSSKAIPGFISFKEVHVVAEGENLNNISMKYYDTPNRWKDIYEANQDVISDIDHLKAGVSLAIPE